MLKRPVGSDGSEGLPSHRISAASTSFVPEDIELSVSGGQKFAGLAAALYPIDIAGTCIHHINCKAVRFGWHIGPGDLCTS